MSNIRQDLYNAKTAIAMPPNSASVLPVNEVAPLVDLGAEVDDVLEGPDVVVRLKVVWLGPLVVERLLGGVETAVLETRVTVAEIPGAKVELGAKVEELTTLEELEESPTEAATILKGKDHWKTLGSSSHTSWRPYVAWVPSVSLTDQLKIPAVLSTPSAIVSRICKVLSDSPPRSMMLTVPPCCSVGVHSIS